MNDDADSGHDVQQLRQNALQATEDQRLDEAIAAWQNVQDFAPDDADASLMLAQLPVLRSRRQWGLEPPAHALSASSAAIRSIGSLAERKFHYVDERNLERVLQEGVEARRTPMQQLEFIVRDSPANPDFYLKLASLYLEKGRDYDAERLLSKARDITDDPQVQELWEDVTMFRLNAKVAAAERQDETERTEASELAYREACKARDSFHTRAFAARADREPDNAALRYELGLRLKQAGKIEQAYECFVQAVADKTQKAAAAFEMADCLQRAGQPVEALQYYRVAADAAVRPEQRELRSQALYRAADIAAQMNMLPLARRYLGLLLSSDPQHSEAREMQRRLGG